MNDASITFKAWTSTKLSMPGFEAWKMEGTRSSTREWNIPDGTSNNYPFISIFITGTIMQVCSNYENVSFINAGYIHTNAKPYLYNNPGKITETVVSNKSLYYCISGTKDEILEANEVRITKDAQYTIPKGWVLFIATGSCIYNSIEYIAEQTVYTTNEDVITTATADILGVCIKVPVTGE